MYRRSAKSLYLFLQQALVGEISGTRSMKEKGRQVAQNSYDNNSDQRTIL